MAHAILHLLEDEEERDAIRERAYLVGRNMTWPVVARQYLESFRRASQSRLARPRPLLAGTQGSRQMGDEVPPLDLGHLLRMTDDVGLLQHAVASVPNYAEGYATDDNARALILTVALEDLGQPWTARTGGSIAIWPSCGMLTICTTGRFRNFMSLRAAVWLEEFGSKDSHTRALWGTGRRSWTLAAGWSAVGGRAAVRVDPAGRPRLHRSAAGRLNVGGPCKTI